MPRPYTSAVVLTPEQRESLEGVTRARSTPQALVSRCRVVLLAAQSEQPTNTTALGKRSTTGFVVKCECRRSRMHHAPLSIDSQSVDTTSRGRRLTKDRERTVRSLETMVRLAMLHLILNRLQPKNTEAEFHYHNAA